MSSKEGWRLMFFSLGWFVGFHGQRPWDLDASGPNYVLAIFPLVEWLPSERERWVPLLALSLAS